MRGETLIHFQKRSKPQISIHSPHARGDRRKRGNLVLREISIHSPHARGDSKDSAHWSILNYFNPLPSCEGRPLVAAGQNLPLTDFNPLPSCEGRRLTSPPAKSVFVFQSTPLMRGETAAAISLLHLHCISIHSPHARGDLHRGYGQKAQSHFNPLPSCEGRLGAFLLLDHGASISIHSPHARGDGCCGTSSVQVSVFQSTPLMRGETPRKDIRIAFVYFNPLPSCEGRHLLI